MGFAKTSSRWCERWRRLERVGWPAIDGFDDALTKDGGFDPAWFAWALGQIEIGPLRGLAQPLDLGELRAFRDRLQQQALDRAGA